MQVFFQPFSVPHSHLERGAEPLSPPLLYLVLLSTSHCVGQPLQHASLQNLPGASQSGSTLAASCCSLADSSNFANSLPTSSAGMRRVGCRRPLFPCSTSGWS